MCVFLCAVAVVSAYLENQAEDATQIDPVLNDALAGVPALARGDREEAPRGLALLP